MNDRFANCFLNITPPPNHTFSHCEEPCRCEPPLDGVVTHHMCPFLKSGYCDRVRRSILNDRLTKAYSEPIKNTMSEPSTCVVVRSEQQFHGMDRQRFSQRRHLYEVVNNGTPGGVSRFGIHCMALQENDRLGEYLGFVDLRQHFEVSPLALGLLVQPGCIREDPNAYVIQGEYGPLFGAHSFRSTVYSMQDKSPTIGAKCAQVCAIMALGMLGDRRAEIKGSFTLTYLAWMLSQGSVSEATRLVDEGKSATPLGSFEATGMNPKQLRDVLRECNVGAEWIDLKYMGPVASGHPAVSDRLAIRLIESYVYARFPVILSVDAWAWRYGDETPENERRRAHAVTIIGVRRAAGSNEVNRLIVHDPGWKPFGERTLDRTFFAARQYSSPDPSHPRNCISMVVATETSIRKHPKECIEWLLKDQFECDDFRCYYAGLPGTDYDIRLLNRNSLFHVLAPGLVEQEKPDLLRRSFPESRFWTISVYRDGRRAITWLFDATTRDELYVAKFVQDADGTLHTLRYRNGTLLVAQL